MLIFADVPLLLVDPLGDVSEHLKRHLDSSIASIFCQNRVDLTQGQLNSRLNNGATQIQQVSPAQGNWPQQPQPKINTLYWPTGASRWAQGLFLIKGDALNAILATMTASGSGSGGSNSNDPQIFQIGTPDARLSTAITGNTPAVASKISTQMYMLPPRPVSPATVPTDDRLWLLPIVDERYFWQMRPVQLTATTWNGVFTQLSSALGITMFVDPISSAYGIPDPIEWLRTYENAAILLDAACLTIGQRFIRDWSFTSPQTTLCRSVNYATAAHDYSVNVVAQTGVIAGGDFSAYAPASMTPGQVVVTFLKDDSTGVKNALTTTNSGSVDANLTKVFHSTMENSGSIIRPDANCAALATQAAADYYAWLAYRYDYDMAGISNWHPSGYDDFVLWEYGTKKGRKRVLISQTRAQSLPYNFGFCNLAVQPTPSTSSSSSQAKSSSSQSTSTSSGSSASTSGSSSSSTNCVTVVTGVTCSGGVLSVSYGSAAACGG